MSETPKMITEMNDRSREVFRRWSKAIWTNGEPVGSRTLTRSNSRKSQRRDDPECHAGSGISWLAGSPHISAGRVPTQMGLRMFVDGLLEVGDPERYGPRKD